MMSKTKIPDGWEKIKLSKIINIVNGYSPSRYKFEKSGDYPFLKVDELNQHEKYISKSRFYTDQGEDDLIPKGSLLFPKRGAAILNNKVRICTKQSLIDSNLMSIHPKENSNVSTEYLYNVITLEKLYKIADVSTIPQLNNKHINPFIIKLPPKPERDKILGYLGTWDNGISILKNLIQAKKRYKKGLMQQLLSGKKRFPEFIDSKEKFETKFGNYPTDWKYIKIRTFAKELKYRKNEELTDYTVLSCTKYDGLVDSLEYFDRQVFSDDLSNYKVVKKGTFAYATNHIEEGSIGYNDWCDVGLISPMYKVFKTDSKKVNDQFLYKLFKTEKYRHIFEINTNGTVNRRGSLGWRSFANIKVPLPHLQEQKEIADTLLAAQEEIDLLEKEVELIKKQKKGLMQQLLTGKVRVNQAEGYQHAL